jgi:CBS domain-containing protein
MGLRGLLQTPPLPSPKNSVMEACRMMDESKLGAVAVVDEGRRVVGVLTYRDLIHRVLVAELDPERASLESVMTPNPVTLGADESFGDALRFMVERDYTYMPVVEPDGRLAGLLSLRGLLEHKIDNLASELDSVVSYIAADGAGGD